MDKKAIWDIDEVLQRHGMLMIKLWLQAAKRSGLSKEESKVVLTKATTGNYLHLVSVLQEYSVPSSNRLNMNQNSKLPNSN